MLPPPTPPTPPPPPLPPDDVAFSASLDSSSMPIRVRLSSLAWLAAFLRFLAVPPVLAATAPDVAGSEVFLLPPPPNVSLTPKSAARTILTFAIRTVIHCTTFVMTGIRYVASRLRSPPHAAFICVIESLQISDAAISSLDIVPPRAR